MVRYPHETKMLLGLFWVNLKIKMYVDAKSVVLCYKIANMQIVLLMEKMLMMLCYSRGEVVMPRA